MNNLIYIFRDIILARGRFSKYLFFVISLFILSSLVNVYVPIKFKEIVDNLNDKNSLIHLSAYSILAYGIIYFIGNFLSDISFIFYGRFEQRSGIILNNYAFEYLLKRIKANFFIKNDNGSVTNIISKGIEGYLEVNRALINNAIPILINLLFVSIVVFQEFNLKTILILNLQVIALFLVLIYFSDLSKKYRQKFIDINIKNSSLEADIILNYSFIKLFGSEEYILDKHKKSQSNFRNSVIKAMDITLIGHIISEGLLSIFIIFILYFSFYNVKNGLSSAGDFVMINTYILMLTRPIQSLAYSYRSIKESLVIIDKFVSIISNKEMENRHDNIDIKLDKPNIKIQNLSIIYDNRTVIANINLDIPYGKKIAIIGESGKGKSSIINALLGFNESYKGDILLNDYNIKDLNKESLLKNFAVLSQDLFLFNDDIKENIKIANAGFDASRQDIEESFKKAAFYEFYMQEGLDYHVGFKGQKLSGGLKQRFLLSLALMKEAPLLILDEPTSNIDDENKKIISDIIKLPKTIIIITHDMEIANLADEIFIVN